MSYKRRNDEKIVLISSKKVELFNPESGEWEQVSNIPYIPLIIDSKATESEEKTTYNLNFTFPYLNEEVTPRETEIYIVDSQGTISHERNQNDEYEEQKGLIRYNNTGTETIKKLKDNEYTIYCITKIRNRLIALANVIQSRKMRTR